MSKILHFMCIGKKHGENQFKGFSANSTRSSAVFWFKTYFHSQSVQSQSCLYLGLQFYFVIETGIIIIFLKRSSLCNFTVIDSINSDRVFLLSFCDRRQQILPTRLHNKTMVTGSLQ